MLLETQRSAGAQPWARSISPLAALGQNRDRLDVSRPRQTARWAGRLCYRISIRAPLRVVDELSVPA